MSLTGFLVLSSLILPWVALAVSLRALHLAKRGGR